MNGLEKLVKEAHRRSLWQVLGIYAVAAWVVMQVVETLTSSLGLPDWFPPLAFVLLLVGLPVVLATAFVQDDVKPGPQSAAPDSEVHEAHASGAAHERTMGMRGFFTWRNAVSGGVLAFALWGILATGWLVFGPDLGARDTRPAGGVGSVAVLPFTSMSADPDNAYFAQGVHDNILTHLSKVGDLSVISRTSVLQYENTDKTIEQIGAELGVGAVLEGSVQRAGGQLRVTTQLIDTRTDNHLWAETYDRTYSVDDLFTIQTDIAERVAQALHATLSAGERAELETRPTESDEAYELYLRGTDFLNRGWADLELNHFNAAANLLTRATETDPAFALAYAKRGEAELAAWQFEFAEARVAAALAAWHRALELHPGLLEAHLGLGWYYDYLALMPDSAYEQYSAALAVQPNNSDALIAMAGVDASRGDRAAALQNAERSVQLDPLSAGKARRAASMFEFYRDYDRAESLYETAVERSPDDVTTYIDLANLYLTWRGDIDLARRTLGRLESRIGADALARKLCLCGADWFQILGDEYERRLQDLDARAFGDDIGSLGTAYRAKAQLFGRDGDRERELAYLDSARALMNPVLADRPDDPYFLTSMAELNAASGHLDESMDMVRRALASLPPEADAVGGRVMQVRAARVYMLAGHFDQAVTYLEPALANPSYTSAARLRVDPFWDPIREHGAFQELLGRYR